MGLAYGLMSKDEFVDRVARYAQEHNMSEEKMMGLVENLFEELEITYKRRQAKQMFEVFEQKAKAQNPESSAYFSQAGHADGQDDLRLEIAKLRDAIEQLTLALKQKTGS